VLLTYSIEDKTIKECGKWRARGHVVELGVPRDVFQKCERMQSLIRNPRLSTIKDIKLSNMPSPKVKPFGHT
jgi:hypothetical protein